MLAILYWWSGSAGSAHLDPKYVFARSLCSPNCNANILVIFCVLWGNGRTANMKLSTPRNHVIHLSLLKLEWEWYRCGYLKSSNKKQHRKSARQKKNNKHIHRHTNYILRLIFHINIFQNSHLIAKFENVISFSYRSLFRVRCEFYEAVVT